MQLLHAAFSATLDTFHYNYYYYYYCTAGVW
jgi:hypothetical protein